MLRIMLLEVQRRGPVWWLCVGTVETLDGQYSLLHVESGGRYFDALWLSAPVLWATGRIKALLGTR